MILFHEIVEIAHLTDDDGGAVLSIVPPDGRRIGPTLIDGDHLRDAGRLRR
jgi:hypothetical protein